MKIQNITLLDIDMLSTFLLVKKSTLYSWVHNGAIPYLKVEGLVRFREDEILAWIESKRRTLRSKKSKPIRSSKPSKVTDIESIIRKSIDNVTYEEYNLPIGKSGLSRGSTKEAF